MHGPEKQPGFEIGDHTATERLVGELAVQSKGGPNVEPQTAAMFKGLLTYGGPQVNSLIAETAHQTIESKGVKAGAAVSHLRTTLIHYFGELYKEINPEGPKGSGFSDAHRNEPKDWIKPIRLLESDLKSEESMASDILYGDLATMTASTPVKERMMGPEIISQQVTDRFPDGERRLDVGSSIALGALQAWYKNEVPMKFARAGIEAVGKGSQTNIDVKPNANAILSRPSNIREIVCVDKVPYYDEERQQWDEGYVGYALSGLRPSERNSRYLDDAIALLDKKRKGKPGYDENCGVKFHRADLLDIRDLSVFKDAHPEPFDFITVNYVTQELSFEEQIKLHEVLCGLLSYNGILIYVHQAAINPGHGNKGPVDMVHIRPIERYATRPWQSNMHVQDNLHPDKKGLQHVMNFWDTRCKSVLFSPTGKLVVNGALEPVSDLVRNRAW